MPPDIKLPDSFDGNPLFALLAVVAIAAAWLLTVLVKNRSNKKPAPKAGTPDRTIIKALNDKEAKDLARHAEAMKKLDRLEALIRSQEK